MSKNELLEKCENDFGVLVETGFIAVKQGDEDSAVKLFRAAQALKPEHSAPKLGFGYISLSKLELGDAAKIFKEILEKEPENLLTAVFLGLTLMLGRMDIEKGHQIVQAALEQAGDDPVIKHFATTVLEWEKEFFAKEQQ